MLGVAVGMTVVVLMCRVRYVLPACTLHVVARAVLLVCMLHLGQWDYRVHVLLVWLWACEVQRRCMQLHACTASTCCQALAVYSPGGR